MGLTPEQIDGKTFARADNGLDPQEVAAFLREVAAEHRGLLDALKEGLRRREPGALAEEVEDLMRTAAESAARITGQADREARALRERAEHEARMIRNSAQSAADRLRRETEHEAAETRRAAEEESRIALERIREREERIVAADATVRDRLSSVEDLIARARAHMGADGGLPESPSRVLAPPPPPPNGNGQVIVLDTN